MLQWKQMGVPYIRVNTLWKWFLYCSDLTRRTSHERQRIFKWRTIAYIRGAIWKWWLQLIYNQLRQWKSVYRGKIKIISIRQPHKVATSPLWAFLYPYRHITIEMIHSEPLNASQSMIEGYNVNFQTPKHVNMLVRNRNNSTIVF